MIYFDNAASTKMCQPALQALMYWSEHCLNPSSSYKAADADRNVIAQTREKIAKVLNCSDNEVYFTSGGSESDNWAFYTATEALSNYGRHIIISAIEHPAVSKCAEFYRRHGYEVSILPVDAEGIVDLQALEKLLRPETILVSVMTANNEVGSLQPIAEIGALLRERPHTLFHTDAVQAFMHENIDVKAAAVDLLSLSGHKFNGPKGIGAFYMNEDKRNKFNLPAFILGGSQERERRAGTVPVPLIAAMGAAIDFHLQHYDEFHKHIADLQAYFIQQLRENFPACQINGSLTRRLVNNINVCLPDVAGEEALILLDFADILASHGSACASGSLDPSPVLLAMGKSLEQAGSSLRFTLGYENTAEEVNQVIAALKNLA
ncbi:cysteine desulfurase family protein [Amygdalobacter indicium]|uniref:cysteine desulfurase family protein n=1 Tax=Amygdalobacter indicium TaxID=3029272 RepID=UPI0027AA0452|nr:cysteine desulfurase family protein [Amygdalobacter indicium]WEG34795.1 cysteine desulfurase family protein [Amygdalobacter indicium]